jgi:hypothetical protein
MSSCAARQALHLTPEEAEALARQLNARTAQGITLLGAPKPPLQQFGVPSPSASHGARVQLIVIASISQTLSTIARAKLEFEF